MAITLTEAAATRVKEHLASRGGGEGLRFGVTRSGCSGLAYELGYADEVGRNDRVFTSHGVKIIVDAGSVEFVDGTSIDYVQDGLSSLFQFNNPNLTEQCGCGESFTTKQ